MHRTERIRQTASGQLTWDEIQKLQNQGWRLIALEWERDVPAGEIRAGEEHDQEDPPFGLRTPLTVQPWSKTAVKMKLSWQ